VKTLYVTEFVLIKNQLAGCVNTGLYEPKLVGIIAGLTRNMFCTHIHPHQPLTFSDLRCIAGVLDPVTDNTNPPPQQWVFKPKKGVDTQQTAPLSKKNFATHQKKTTVAVQILWGTPLEQ